jgi:hypothetical protein
MPQFISLKKGSMGKAKRFYLFNLLTLLVSLSSCSQLPNNDSGSLASFEATTPCDEVSRSLLHIPSTDKSEMMKWNLTLLTPTSYKLVYIYGIAKQGTRGFSDGAITKEQSGSWTTGKYKSMEIVTLTADNLPSLSFLKLNENVLHLLDANKNLVVGNGAWSYTLNRIDPVNIPSNEGNRQKVEETLLTDSLVFEGRTPCYEPLLALSGKTTAGCNLVKCRITFFRDSQSHAPSFLKFYSIHVGTGGTRYVATGTWVIMRGTKNDPNSILYRLQFNPEKPQQDLTFLKGDDNILFLLDNEFNCMPGNNYSSYTLNRIRR